MSYSPTVYMLNLVVCVSEADSKVMKVILERRAHFAARKVTVRNDTNTAAKNEHRVGLTG